MDTPSLKDLEKLNKINDNEEIKNNMSNNTLMLKMFTILEDIIIEQNKVISNLTKNFSNIGIETQNNDSGIAELLPTLLNTINQFKTNEKNEEKSK